jgi:stage II sporulation protein GA (sporulation sigma-E factor processing peptidase)
MIVIAFGKLKLSDILKQWIVLNLITYFVGGFMNSLYYHTNIRMIFISIGNNYIFSNLSFLYIIMVICVVALITLFALWLLRQYRLHSPLVYDVELVLEDRHIRTRGLMDTGNCLYDPTLGKPVMIIENAIIDELMTPNIRQDMETARAYLDGKSEDIPGYSNNIFRFSFIPYRSIGKSGMLLGIRLDKVTIYTENESICNERVTAAICDNRLTGGRVDYHVILHKELL